MPANNKIITLDNLTEYDTKIKEYILNSALRELTEDTNIWELSQGIYRAAPGIKLYYNTNSGYITVGAYGDLLSVALSSNGSTPFYLMGRGVQGNETINTIVVGVAQNNMYGVCDVYDLAEMRSVVHIYNNQTIYGVKTFANLPESTVVPTTDKQLVNKKYVDDSLLSNAVYLGKVTDYNTQEKALNFDNLKEGVYYIIFDSTILYCKLTNSQGDVTTQSVSFSGMDYKLTPAIYLIVSADIIPEETQANSAIATFQYLRYGTSYISGESDYDLVNQKFIARLNSANSLSIVESKGSREYVSATSAQTISGKKTFGTLPESSVVPTTDDQLTNKKYVDDTVSNIGDVNQYFITGNSSSNPFIFKGKKKGVYHFIDKRPSDNIYYKFDTSDSVTSDPLVPLEINILKDIDGTEANGTLLGYTTKTGASFRPFSSVYCVEIKRGTSSSTGLSTGIPANGSIQYVTVEHSQTISSEKTFSTLPKSTVVPKDDAHLVNKKYVDDNSVKLITTNTNIWELAHGVYKVEAGVQLNYKPTSSGYITVGNYGTFLFVSKASNGSVPFYLLGRSVTNNTNNEMYIGVAQNNTYGICDVYNLGNIELAVTTTDNQTIYGVKNFYVLPESSVVPTTNNQLVNKKYVDDTVIQKSTMPTASSTNLGTIIQYIGTTDGTYTNGYFYKCVSDGEETPTYSWQNISVQSGGSGQSAITQNTYIKDLSPGVYLCTKSYNLYLGSSTTYYIGGYGLLEVSAGNNNAINFTFTTNDGRYYYVNADSELNSGNITTGTIITGVVQSNGNYTVYSRTTLGTLIDRSENTSSNLCRVYVGHKAPTVSSSEVVTTTIKNYTITTTYVEPNTYSLSIASSMAAKDVAMTISHGIGLIRVGDLVANTPKTYTINVNDDDDIDIWVYEHFGDFRPEVSLTGDYDDLINKPVTYLGKATDYDSSAERLDISTLKQNTVYAIWYNHSRSNADKSLYVKIPINGTTYNYDFIINGRYFGSDIALADGMFIYLVVVADLSTTISTGPIFYAFEQFNSINFARTISFNGSSLTSSSTNYNRGIVDDSLDQTISGVKTFNSFPLVSGTPTLNNELINKGFADTTYASQSDLSSLITYGTTDLSPGDTLPDGTLYIVYDNN